MNPKQRSDTLLAGLQQLCSLGLSSEVVAPDLLQGLNAWMSADNSHFIWVDQNLNPDNFYCPTDQAAMLQVFSALFDNLTAPGQKSYQTFLTNPRAMVQGGPNAKDFYHSSLYDILRNGGGECLISVPIRDAAGLPRASLGLLREKRAYPFTAEERWRYEQFANHLSLLFPPTRNSGANAPERIGEQGMAIFDATGQLLHCDERARQLLFLAGHPKLRPASDRRRQPKLDQLIRRTCAALQTIARGTPTAPPAFSLTTAWGRMVFRAHRLAAPAGGDAQTVGMDIVRYIPRRIATWRQISTLDLPLRQRQVCLEFAENRSLSDIAALLGISRNTVIDHVNRIYARYGLEPGRENLQEYLLGRDEFDAPNRDI